MGWPLWPEAEAANEGNTLWSSWNIISSVASADDHHRRSQVFKAEPLEYNQHSRDFIPKEQVGRMEKSDLKLSSKRRWVHLYSAMASGRISHPWFFINRWITSKSPSASIRMQNRLRHRKGFKEQSLPKRWTDWGIKQTVPPLDFSKPAKRMRWNWLGRVEIHFFKMAT